ncbi:Zinc-type alcohol dehydrogenase-like protein [Colletotrichum spinosum]|uniref:Zinc-type alcohol dehydrogenase-like protein n=1 Tax=Colletotrichum spinosum TaxID=1347390 RepID=A0A4R8Q5D2_9PEZI|nr:Zinc-type alcohol dehydrogenase-like protein [Colletotrichum spinosum]
MLLSFKGPVAIAVAVGATVVAFSTSEDKLDILRGLGASQALSYRDRSDWSRDVLDLTGGRGADHVVDVVGAATIAESLRPVRQDGLVSAVGFLSASENHDLIPDIIWGAKTVRGLLYGSLGMFQEMAAFVEENKIEPVISEVFGWTDAKEAYKRMLKQGFVGKIVIKL